MTSKVLILGAGGQIGSELTLCLQEEYGKENVIAADINDKNKTIANSSTFEILDARDYNAIKKCITTHNIDTVYLMAAMLSATGEKHPMEAWNLNINSLLHVLNLAKDKLIKHIFWPSSIAVFGNTTPKINTPQTTIMEPSTVYGISKQVGERWCEYYHKIYGVDVRSVRYPGVVSWKTQAGGGTTDYAVEIFHKALTEKAYTSFLSENTSLPMMYMDDAINATRAIMKAPSESLTIRSSYNISALNFTPKELAAAIQKHIPDFKITYKPDFRQDIADSWPSSINDLQARQDWKWAHEYEIDNLVTTMIKNLKTIYHTN